MSVQLTEENKNQYLASSGFVLVVETYYGTTLSYGLFPTPNDAYEFLGKLTVTKAFVHKVLTPQFNQG
jgi:hypothetical protein